MKEILNQFGMSAVELIIGVALMAGIAVVSTKTIQMQSQTNTTVTNNVDIENTVKLLSDALKKKSVCDTIFMGSTIDSLNNDTSINTGVLGIQLGQISSTGTSLDEIAANAISPVGSEGRTSAKIKLKFSKFFFENGKKIKRNIERTVVADLYVNTDNSIECSSYNSTKIVDDSLAGICNTLTNGTTGACDITNLHPALMERIQIETCEMISGGSISPPVGSGYGIIGSGGLARCLKVALEDDIDSANLSKNKVCINGVCRKKFQTACPSGYLIGVSPSGEVINCDGVKPPGAIPSGGSGSCTKGVTYNLAGDGLSATGVQTCTATTYDSTDVTCSTKSETTNSAGICKRYSAGSCSGSVAGTIENSDDGTSCGIDKECNAGVCETTTVSSCTKGIIYNLTGDGLSATGIHTCTATVFESTDATCSTTNEINSSAGICKRYSTGSCVDSTAGIVESFPDKTSCGTNKECIAGVCETIVSPDNFCPGGLAMYPSLAACESGGYDCSISLFLKTNPMLSICSDPPEKGCKEYFCRGEKPKVDCVGQFEVASSISCPQTDAECLNIFKNIEAWVDKPATYNITTPASGGGMACPYKDGDSGVKKCGSCQCFIAGTEITMADGTYKNIEDVVVGDKLLGSNGKANTVLVLKHNDHSGKKYSINGGLYFVTEGHPFMTTQGWKAFNPKLAMEINPTLNIGQLVVGDVLIKGNSYEFINKIDFMETDSRVYNFELNGTKDYYADNFLVHNK